MNEKLKYICGNAFKSICKYSSGSYKNATRHEFDFRVRSDLDNNLVFVNTHYPRTFFLLYKIRLRLHFNFSQQRFVDRR